MHILMQKENVMALLFKRKRQKRRKKEKFLSYDPFNPSKNPDAESILCYPGEL